MERKFFVFICFLACTFSHTLFAQNEDKTSTVKFSFWDPVGTNGKEAKYYTNTFSFNVLYGESKSEKAFTFSGLGSIIKEDANGLQIAGLANIIGGNSNGLQFAGLTNISTQVNGAQIAGLTNITNDAKGFLFAGLNNISNEMNGISIAGLGNIANNVRGFQFAGLGNISNNMKGVQFGGLGNVANNVNGFQFGGIFNKANVVNGVQFAGLVNIADHSDYPIGILNFIKDGEKSVGVTFDELQNLTVAFRSGGRILYGILGAGVNFKASETLTALEAGFGAHINCTSKFRINTELTYTSMTDFDNLEISRSSLRIMPAYRFAKCFEIFAGPTLNYLQTNDTELYDMFSKSSLWKETKSSGDKSQLNIGYIGGLHWIF